MMKSGDDVANLDEGARTDLGKVQFSSLHHLSLGESEALFPTLSHKTRKCLRRLSFFKCPPAERRSRCLLTHEPVADADCVAMANAESDDHTFPCSSASAMTRWFREKGFVSNPLTRHEDKACRVYKPCRIGDVGRTRITANWRALELAKRSAILCLGDALVTGRNLMMRCGVHSVFEECERFLLLVALCRLSQISGEEHVGEVLARSTRNAKGRSWHSLVYVKDRNRIAYLDSRAFRNYCDEAHIAHKSSVTHVSLKTLENSVGPGSTIYAEVVLDIDSEKERNFSVRDLPDFEFGEMRLMDHLEVLREINLRHAHFVGDEPFFRRTWWRRRLDGGQKLLLLAAVVNIMSLVEAGELVSGIVVSKTEAQSNEGFVFEGEQDMGEDGKLTVTLSYVTNLREPLYHEFGEGLPKRVKVGFEVFSLDLKVKG
jgi:hypothetical protein